jgi:hypothetical protein
MRFKSEKTDGYQVFAVSGTNTISFGIDFKDADIKGLLGFAVERVDQQENQHYYMYGFKVFSSVIPHPDKKTKSQPSTIQSRASCGTISRRSLDRATSIFSIR